MGVAEIITELPKLTPAGLRLIRQKLIEIVAEDQETAAGDDALEGAQMLDQLEALALLQGRLALDANKVGVWQTAACEARR